MSTRIPASSVPATVARIVANGGSGLARPVLPKFKNKVQK